MLIDYRAKKETRKAVLRRDVANPLKYLRRKAEWPAYL